MLRATGRNMMLRRTAIVCSGDKPHVYMDNVPHCHPVADAPSADVAVGFFQFPYVGGLTPLRLIDPIWVVVRCQDLGREGYIAGPGFNIFLWLMWWYLPMKALWGDKKPPQDVDWNKGKTGYLTA